MRYACRQADQHAYHNTLLPIRSGAIIISPGFKLTPCSYEKNIELKVY